MSVRRQRVLEALGTVVVVLGLLFVAAPGLASQFSTDRVLITLLGVLAFAQGFRVVQSRRHTTLRRATTGDPETRQRLPTPGDDFDDLLGKLYAGGHFEDRERAAERLEAAAVATVARAEGCSEDVARDRLQDGTWTDDPHAAAFFTGELDAPLLEKIRVAATLESRFRRRATHAAVAIADLSREASGS